TDCRRQWTVPPRTGPRTASASAPRRPGRRPPRASRREARATRTEAARSPAGQRLQRLLDAGEHLVDLPYGVDLLHAHAEAPVVLEHGQGPLAIFQHPLANRLRRVVQPALFGGALQQPV